MKLAILCASLRLRLLKTQLAGPETEKHGSGQSRAIQGQVFRGKTCIAKPQAGTGEWLGLVKERTSCHPVPQFFPVLFSWVGATSFQEMT